MAMTPDIPFRRLFREALTATLDAHAARIGIDRDGWLSAADARFEAANAGAVPFLEREAVAALKRQVQDEFIRSSRDPRIERERELSAVVRAASRGARIEQIEIEPGQYVPKRVLDCSRRELRLLAEQYERRARGMWRRAEFYRRVERQLALAGLADDQAMRDWLAA